MELKWRATQEVEHKYPCPSCGDKGIIDFIDLVRGKCELHCRSCPEIFESDTEATMAHLID